MRNRFETAALCAAAFWIVAAPIRAHAGTMGATISQGSATFKLGDFPNTSSPDNIAQILSSDLKFNNFDPLNSTAWFVRYGDQTREYTLTNWTSSTITKDYASFDFAAPNYDATLSFYVQDVASGAALVEVLSLRNLANQDVPVSVFNYSQFSGLGDTKATLANNTKPVEMSFAGQNGTVTYQDKDASALDATWKFFGMYSSAWHAGVADTTGFSLTDNQKTTWDNLKLPFDTSDMIGAGFEFDKTLAAKGGAGGASSLVAAVTIRTTEPQTPEPGTIGLVGAGLIVPSLLRRRKR